MVPRTRVKKIFQVEMPEGWDPEGPSEQVIALPVDASASEEVKKDEL